VDGGNGQRRRRQFGRLLKYGEKGMPFGKEKEEHTTQQTRPKWKEERKKKPKSKEGQGGGARCFEGMKLAAIWVAH
jgi:hypothetical protein